MISVRKKFKFFLYMFLVKIRLKTESSAFHRLAHSVRCTFFEINVNSRMETVGHVVLGSLRSDVLKRRSSTGSELFSLLICLDDIKFVFLSFFTVIEAI